jgi:hypothetical protein
MALAVQQGNQLGLACHGIAPQDPHDGVPPQGLGIEVGGQGSVIRSFE